MIWHNEKAGEFILLGVSVVVDGKDYLAKVTDVIREIGGVQNLEPGQDFYDAGFTSVKALPLLMELEDRFGVTIPDDRFIAARTPQAICQLIAEIKQD